MRDIGECKHTYYVWRTIRARKDTHMTREDIIRKLTSRKLWVSVASFVSMLIVALGQSENVATQVTSLIIAGATVLGYVIGEGLVDSAREGSDQPVE